VSGKPKIKKTSSVRKALLPAVVNIEKTVPIKHQMTPVTDVLLGVRFKTGHICMSYPDGHMAKRMIEQGMRERGIDVEGQEIRPADEKRKIILHQKQSPGDILTFTRGVVDLKLSYPKYKIDVRSPASAIWENCPYLTPLKDDDPEVEHFEATYGVDRLGTGIHQSGWRGFHFTDAFREDLEANLCVKIRKTSVLPEIWLSDEEKGWINQVEVEFGWTGPFWILNAGSKPDNELKQYHRWQEVVDNLNEYFKDRVKIVQIGHKAHNHPELKGVLSLVGKTDLRQLIRLAWWAHGSIGPLSFQFVLSAALRQSHVVVAAGKEGVRWHLYPHGRYLYTNGAIDCCRWDGCWLGGDLGECKKPVDGVPLCFRMIKPHMISDSVIMYYEGGMLGWGRGK